MSDRDRVSYRAAARSRLTHRFYLWAKIAAAVCAVLWFGTLTPSYQACVGEYAQHQESKEANVETFISVPTHVRIFIECEGGVLDANGVLITAIATIAIASFTWTLKQSTDRLWKSSEEGLHAIERAFVYIKRMQTEAIPVHALSPHSIHQWRILVTWGNSGKTPTRHLVNHASWEAFEGGIFPERFQFRDTWEKDAELVYTTGFLGPNAEMDTSILTIDADKLAEIYADKKAICIWGWAEYDDVFTNTPRHRTEFCTVLDLAGNPRQIGQHKMTFRMHREFNGADDECYHAPKPYPPRPSKA